MEYRCLSVADHLFTPGSVGEIKIEVDGRQSKKGDNPISTEEELLKANSQAGFLTALLSHSIAICELVLLRSFVVGLQRYK